jgi:hypothetical protein
MYTLAGKMDRGFTCSYIETDVIFPHLILDVLMFSSELVGKLLDPLLITNISRQVLIFAQVLFTLFVLVCVK